ncbi:MAG: NUDIX hydrolase [candidate division Zixibacteria bacterium]|nr:NUDIX hydrolase [candidate division Zixibacteria bacterium]
MEPLLFSDFELIPFPFLSQSDIVLKYSDKLFKIPPDEEKKVNEIWEELLSEDNNRILYDGPMVRTKAISGTIDRPVFELERTSYRVLCGTNLRNPRAENRYCADGNGICGLIVTSDNKVILGKRSNKVFEHPGLYHVIGGNMEPELHKNLNNVPDPFIAFQHELKEETGIETSLDNILLIGFARNGFTGKPEFLFYTKVEESSKEIELDDVEHSEILFFENSRDRLVKFTTDNRDIIVPVGKAALTAYGINRNGND